MYLSFFLSVCTGKPEKRSVRVDAARSIHSTEDMVQVYFLLGDRNPMRICNQPRRHPRRNSIQIHGLELMLLSALYGFRELWVVLNSYPTRGCGLLSWAPVSSIPIVQIASTALGVQCITRITRPHVHCFSDPRFGALSSTKLRVHPLPFSSLPPPTPP